MGWAAKLNDGTHKKTKPVDIRVLRDDYRMKSTKIALIGAPAVKKFKIRRKKR